jgi:hypothetical protein
MPIHPFGSPRPSTGAGFRLQRYDWPADATFTKLLVRACKARDLAGHPGPGLHVIERRCWREMIDYLLKQPLVE